MNIRRQNGLTLIGFIIVLIVSLFFAYAAMRLVPTYLEYFSVVNALNTLEADPASRKMEPALLKQKIMTSLWISYSDNNVTKKNIRVSKKTNGVNVRVVYEVRKPFLGNVDVIASFDRTAVLR